MRVLAAIPHTRCYSPAWESIQAATAGVDTVYLREGDRGDVPYYVNVEGKLHRAKTLAVAGDYDALWLIDDDNILPTDAYARLVGVLQQGADIAYGLNTWRNAPHHWSATLDRTETSIDTLDMQPELAAAAWGKVIDVLGIGFYCTLLSRRALQATPLERWGSMANDCYAADDWRKAGLVSRCDLGLVCGHMLDSHTSVWPVPPDGGDGAYYRTEAH